MAPNTRSAAGRGGKRHSGRQGKRRRSDAISVSDTEVETRERVPEKIIAKASQRREGVSREVFLVKWVDVEEPEYVERGALKGHEQMIVDFLSTREQASSSSSISRTAVSDLLGRRPEDRARDGSGDAAATPVVAAPGAATTTGGNTTRTSFVWRAVDDTAECTCTPPCLPGAKHVICKASVRFPAHCPEGPCDIPVFPTSGNTTNAKNHLRRHHPTLFVHLAEEETAEAEKRAERQARDNNRLRGSFTASRQDQVNVAIARWVCRSNRPLAIVKDEQLRHAFKVASAGEINIPQEEKTRSEILLLEARAWGVLRNVVKELALEGFDLSIGADIWSEGGVALLGVCAYAIVFRHGQFHLIEFVVCAAPFSEVRHRATFRFSH
eukprot:GHVU01097460.1.p1 GENE.GHVU01097460.1~~GHVU01097460.1.p1  ORF type:complete len:382 (-),score=39.35 GHVU01097460.1:2618-3763(-)